ncbi:unnamed protein product [Owenia fusiformis]|uniref:Uncharacterized protein n=1 Tax=Owenia fusiformis TaxID=6347 RepID=A0A8J1UAG9_OWEFU|nr:unnamed protein product [Owenia fusiformis]
MARIDGNNNIHIPSGNVNYVRIPQNGNPNHTRAHITACDEESSVQVKSLGKSNFCRWTIVLSVIAVAFLIAGGITAAMLFGRKSHEPVIIAIEAENIQGMDGIIDYDNTPTTFQPAPVEEYIIYDSEELIPADILQEDSESNEFDDNEHLDFDEDISEDINEDILSEGSGSDEFDESEDIDRKSDRRVKSFMCKMFPSVLPKLCRLK